jgi:TonB-dependent SusC/RagA subfamily outer membrane receptor
MKIKTTTKLVKSFLSVALLFLYVGTFAQTKTITGIVKDNENFPIPGVNVIIKGTKIHSVTDQKGQYTLPDADEKSTIVFSFIGFLTQEIAPGNKTTINVNLKADAQTLNEMVVVGYGVQKKANLTGAVDQVRGDVLQNRPIPNLTQGLQGVMPNLNIRMQDGKPTQSPQYNIRGTTSIGQGGSALVLIDGFEGDPSLLNPNDVESVSILKDAASAAIYGARGAFGVLLITTKKPEKGRTNIAFSTNVAIKTPLQTPDFVTDGYTWAKMFSEAFVNGDGAFPQNANKTQKFSQAYLDEFKRRVDSGQPYNQVEVNPTTGEYTYYGSTDWYSVLYKKSTVATENNLSVSSGLI